MFFDMPTGSHFFDTSRAAAIQGESLQKALAVAGE
jgi:hypothetical protein